jgi:ubiquinone/menaquinone biosynthesis C-methylase UbiE
LVELAGIQPGHHVLDIATGIGEPAVTAARKVGPTGFVVATDLSPQMLALGRERAAELGLSNIEFREMDADVLDFPESRFDAVLSRWALMFLVNLPETLVRIRQMLVPGGRLAAAVLGARENISVVLTIDLIRGMLQTPPLPAGTPDPCRLADEKVTAQLFLQAGLTNVHTERLMIKFELPSAEAYAQWCAETQAPISALLASQPTEKQAEVMQAITQFTQQYAEAGGTVYMPFESVLIVGQKG